MRGWIKRLFKFNRFDYICIICCNVAIIHCIIGYYSFLIWPEHPTLLGYNYVWWFLGGAYACLMVAGFFLYKAERLGR